LLNEEAHIDDSQENVSVLKDAISSVQSNVVPTDSLTISISPISTQEQFTLQKDPKWRRGQAALHTDILNVIKLSNDNSNPIKAQQTSITVPAKSVFPKKKDFCIMDVDPSEIARQLTLIEEQYLRKCGSTELLLWINDTKQCPNILIYTHWNKHMETWIKLEILSILKVKLRAKVIKHFIEVVQNLLSLNNINSALSIYKTLTSTPILDLKKTNDLIKKDLSELDKLIAPVKILNINEGKDNVSCIPAVSNLLDNIHVINQTPTLSNGRINWNKLRSLASYIIFMRKSTTTVFSISNVEMVKSFLRQRIDFNIQKGDLDALINLAINSDASNSLPGNIPQNLNSIINKYVSKT